MNSPGFCVSHILLPGRYSMVLNALLYPMSVLSL